MGYPVDEQSRLVPSRGRGTVPLPQEAVIITEAIDQSVELLPGHAEEKFELAVAG